MSYYNVETVRQSITIITKILSGKGLKVTQSGDQAFVESVAGIPKRINIPYIPDNASDELMLAINGFLDHEVAHVLFTDFSISQKHHFKSHTVFQIYNIIEDCRIEACMKAKFAGSKVNLEGVASFLIDRYLKADFEKAKASGDEKQIIGSLFVPAMRAWSGQDIFKHYMSDKRAEIKPLADKIRALLPKIPAVASTQDAVDLAHEINKLLEKKKEPKPESESPKTDKKEKTPEEEDDDEPKPKDEPGEEPGEEPESDDSNDGEDSEEGDDDHDGDDDSDGRDDGDSDEEGDDDETSVTLGDSDEGGDSGSDEEGDSNSDEDGDEGSDSEFNEDDETEVSVNLSDAVGDANFDTSKSVAEIIAKEIADHSKDKDYKIFSTDFDKIERFDATQHYSSSDVCRTLVNMETQTRQVAGSLQKTLERLVKAKAIVRNLPGKRSGRINSSSLFRLKTGDDRVFRQRDIGVNSEVAVSLFVDCSGSMSGSKIRIAMQGAFALCDVLSKLGISNEVIGFTTDYSNEVEEAMRKQGEDENRFSRIEPLYLPIFKGFDEKFGTEQKMRIASGSMGGYLRNNVDGESLRAAAKRLMTMTSERGKQMIVLSDGCPCAEGSASKQRKDLKDAVKEIEKMGIKVIGIGINDSSVRDYYTNHIVISNVGELPGMIVKELKALLV